MEALAAFDRMLPKGGVKAANINQAKCRRLEWLFRTWSPALSNRRSVNSTRSCVQHQIGFDGRAIRQAELLEASEDLDAPGGPQPSITLVEAKRRALAAFGADVEQSGK